MDVSNYLSQRVLALQSQYTSVKEASKSFEFVFYTFAYILLC